MSTALLNLILYLPFAIPALLFGIPYLITGFRKGLFPSLLSLAVTLAAAVCSLFLSVFLSETATELLSQRLLPLLPQELFDSLGVFSNFALSLATGLIRSALSLVLFAVVFLVLVTVFKFVANRISRMIFIFSDMESPASRWGGLAVRFCDALLVAFLLTLPLYAFLSTAVAPVGNLMKLAKIENTEILSYVDCVTAHPMVRLCNTKPTAAVISRLSRFQINDADFDVSQMATTVNGLFERFETLQSSTPEEKAAALRDFVDYARSEVVEEEWCYELVVSAKAEIENQLDELITDEKARQEVEEVLEILDMDQEQFADTATAILDFTAHVMESDLLTKAESGELSELPEETMDRLGDLLNQNKQICSLKKHVVNTVVEEIFIASYESNSPSGDAAEKAKEDSKEFIDRFFQSGEVPKEETKKEVEAFLMLLSAKEDEDVREAIEMHPLLGAEAVQYLTDRSILPPALQN